MSLATALPLLGCGALPAKFQREIGGYGLSADGRAGPVVTEADLAPLPPAAQRYLRFMGVVGRPRDTTFHARLTGRFRRTPDAGWSRCEIEQLNSRPDVARIFYIRLPGAISFLARDTYAGGRGRMLVKVWDLFTAVDAGGETQAIAELVTFLNDAVLLAPSMLLAPDVGWTAVDDASFDVALTHAGRTVSARVFLDERGAPRDFSTTDRFGEDPFEPGTPTIRARWTTPIDGWTRDGDRAIPTSARAVWHFPKGDFTYVEVGMGPGQVRWNVAPGG